MRSPIAALLALASSASAIPCHLSNVLGDHAVLQRDKPAIVWGFGNPGATVTTTFAGNKLQSTVDANNTWRQILPAQPATTTPQTISFACSTGETFAMADVLFGDVHICSGQSNMQFTLLSNAGVPNATAEIANANNYPLIRLFTVGQGNSSTTPFTELASIEQPWVVAANSSVGGPGWDYFSAACWFTYRDVFDALGGTVPQGLISNNWGGTPIQHWTAPEGLAECSGGKDSTLWNAMVVPYTVGPMAVRTAIWYQGEANVGAAAYYACQFPVMITSWRSYLPTLNTFGFVQIAGWTGYGTGGAAGDLRQAQMSPVASLANIAFTTAIDIVAPWSSPTDIHPTYKQAVGARLAAQILDIEYGFATQDVYPAYAGASTATSGTAITVDIELSGCVGGCYLTPQVLPEGVTPNVSAAFLIQTNDAAKTWWNASASITATGLQLAVTAPTTGLAAIATSYGRAAYPLAVAFNSQNLPLLPWCNTLAGETCYAANDVDELPRGAVDPRWAEADRAGY